MKKLLFWMVLIVGTVALLGSCSKEESTIAAADNTTTVVASISSFNGTWIGACPGANNPAWKMVIADTTAAVVRAVYTDSDCENESHNSTFNYTVSSTATDTVDGKSVTKIEGTLTTIIMTLNTDSRTSSAEDNQWCGKSEWVKGTGKDVTGANCQTALSETFAAAGSKGYDIWYINDNTFMNYAFDSEGYPENLDDLVYTKQ